MLVVIGESLSKRMLRRMQQDFPTARRVLYMWDSFSNKPALVENIEYFDKVFSFDRDDVRRYGLGFRALFFLDEFRLREPVGIRYDLSFIGTVHADRHRVASALLAQVPRERTFRYFYVQSRLIYAARWSLDASLRSASPGEVGVTPLPREKMRNTVFESEAVIDIQHPRQTGLTVRTFEALAAQRKLITTNADIANYEFFNPENVLIVDRKRLPSVREFLQTPAIPPNEDFMRRYSVDGWLRDVLA